jgi:hypothetical protein
MSANNWSSRMQDNRQMIKTFLPSNSNNTVNWIYKTTTPSPAKVITPADATKTVLIPNDLLVLGSINNPSDINLKDNIEQINVSAEDFNKLNPVSFTFKDDDQNKKHFGVIAQELEGLYPELVTNSEIGFKTVNYIEMIPILLSQMKNMQQEIEKLKEEIKEIKEQTK